MIHCVTLKFDNENICPIYIHTYIHVHVHVHVCMYVHVHVMSCGGLILHKNIYVMLLCHQSLFNFFVNIASG